MQEQLIMSTGIPPRVHLKHFRSNIPPKSLLSKIEEQLKRNKRVKGQNRLNYLQQGVVVGILPLGATLKYALSNYLCN